MLEHEIEEFKNFYPTYGQMIEEFKKVDIDLVRVKLTDGRIGYFNTISYYFDLVYMVGFSYEKAWRYAFKTLLANRMDYKYMSQSDLSKASGISQGTISGYLSGRKMPSTVSIVKLAKALGVKSSYFTDCLMDIL